MPPLQCNAKFKGCNSASGVGSIAFTDQFLRSNHFWLVSLAIAMSVGCAATAAAASSQIRGDRDRRQHRQDAVFGERRRAALSGVADQDDDALSDLRGARRPARSTSQHADTVLGAAPQPSRRPSSASRRAARSPSRRRSIRWSPSRPTTSATALAELLGGSEAGFARMMTAKARQLGMTGTIFRNAHGLPNTAQHSTARDMATLGIALREHFPQYYGYFSTRSFTYGKQPHGQPQPPARPRQGRRRHQDRLYARVRLQPGLLGFATATAASSPSSWAAQSGGVPRQAHGRTDREIPAEGVDARRRPADRQGRQLADRGDRFAPCCRRARRRRPRCSRKPTWSWRQTKPRSWRLKANRSRLRKRLPKRRRRRSSRPMLRRNLCRSRSRARMADVDPISTSSTAPDGLGDPGRLLAERKSRRQRASSPRPASRRRRSWPIGIALHRPLRQGRRHLLPRPLRRLRIEDRRLGRLQRAEEKEDRLLRRPAIGRRPERFSRNCIVSKES